MPQKQLKYYKKILVSFQENEELQILSTSSREFPAMLRRGSIAPLAARIRANRPPTAPPGSIYLKDSDVRYINII